MVDPVLNDDEKVQQLKQWWNKYGNLLSTIVLACLIAIVGWQYWQRHEAKVAQQASQKYQQLLVSFANHDHATTQGEANELIKEYGSTPYAQVAALILANEAVGKKQFDVAEKKLQWVIQEDKQPAFTQLAKIRLARIHLAQKKSAQALKLVASIDQSIYPGLQAWVEAQAFAQEKKLADARAAYMEALTHMPEHTPLYLLIQMQLNHLPAHAS